MTLVGTWPHWECSFCGWGIAVNPEYDWAHERVEAGSLQHMDSHCEEFADQMGRL